MSASYDSISHLDKADLIEAYNAFTAKDQPRAGRAMSKFSQDDGIKVIQFLKAGGIPEGAEEKPKGVDIALDLFGEEESEPRGRQTTPSTTTRGSKGKERDVSPADSAIDVSEQELREMWIDVDEINFLDIEDLEEIVKTFEYQGFNPDAILKSMIKRMKIAKLTKPQFLKDVSILCALAIIKGSITDRNITKMSDKGKMTYEDLEKRYGISRGGGKGKAAEVVTVSRIAAAFPGTVLRLIQEGKVPSRTFVSDFKTHKLPGVLRHQALAACTPKDLPERSKNFVLGIVTAFSVDQSKVISNSKSDVGTLVDRQQQFTLTAHNGIYPPDKIRTTIFKAFKWSTLFVDILPIANHIKTKWSDFDVVTKEEFLSDLAKLK